MDDLTWPDNFMDIGNKRFVWVFDNKKEFVDFTVKEMENPKGLFKKWQTYCKARLKFEREK